MVIHYTNIYNNVVFPDKKACIFRFKGRKSCANGDSVTLEFMIFSALPSTCASVYVVRLSREYARRTLVLLTVQVPCDDDERECKCVG